MLEIRRLTPEERSTHLHELAGVLIDCVEGGASVSFMPPFLLCDAEAYFTGVFDSVRRNERVLLAAFLEDRLLGTVQIVTAMPPNQPHRGEISKLLVHRRARGRGVGQALMERAEEEASREGKTLLVLDTATGGAGERLYARLNWTRAGTIPNFALFPDGRWTATTFFWKQLSPVAVSTAGVPDD
jgi:GNAT superfamily N-acetyltransferase